MDDRNIRTESVSSILGRSCASREEAESEITAFLIKNAERIVLVLGGGAYNGFERSDNGWHYARMARGDRFEDTLFPDEFRDACIAKNPYLAGSIAEREAGLEGPCGNEELDKFERYIEFLKRDEEFGLSDEEALELLRRDFAWRGIAYWKVSGEEDVRKYARG